MDKKNIYVILAFHAHEPLWDLPGSLQKNFSDFRIAHAITPENYLRKRAKEGRNIYRDLISFAKDLGIKVTLDVTNELLHQIRLVLPRTFEEIKKAYREEIICPIYTTAHHTHIALLNKEELLEEIKLNKEFIHKIMEAPEPQYKGFFFTENSVDARYLDCLSEEKIDYIVFPHLNKRKANFTLEDPAYNYNYYPFKARNVTAIPRNFSVSQQIWNPITRWYPQEVKYQGYLMGEYFVFEEEYRDKKYLDFPIDKRRAINEYYQVLKKALEEAPDEGIIFYIQDLELMDFGDVALEIMQASWHRILDESEYNVRFTGPDEYLESIKGNKLPKINFSKISWAPEIRLVLRYDGHYPPLEAGEYNGIDIVPKVFRKHPFIFWEPGRYFCEFFTWLIKAFKFPLTIDTEAGLLSEEDYQLHRFPYEKRLPLHLRLMKRACNWGWRPDEGRAKRPYLHGLIIADSLLLLKKFYPERLPKVRNLIDKKVLEGIKRLPEILIDTRIACLNFGLERQRDETGFDPSEAYRELDYAKDFRNKAYNSCIKMEVYYRDLLDNFSDKENWKNFLLEVREHCRNMFLSLEHIQRAWGKGGDTEFLVMSMYKYLYDLYPPRYPEILESL